ncbi:MAG: DUF1178 family protein [Methylobacteriaceae bacterium]|nr:DUF1178 family protein [Methylobacteriaceae bacterium]
MIRYALACTDGHDFESWFPSSASYDMQAERGLVSCPVCGSAKVAKRLMAPAVAAGRGAAREPAAADGRETGTPTAAPGQPIVAPPQPVALLSEKEQAIRAMLRAVREHVTRTADYVGPTFAEEARRMHYGEIEHRSIYGEASPVEVQALAEEGIEFQPLPVVPDDRN